MFDFTRSLQAGSEESRQRSDILKPLIWPLGLFLTAAVCLSTFDGPAWLAGACGVMAGFILIFYVASYVFFAFRAPDALRSESYTLKKMAIERGITGDSLTGITADDSIKSSRSSAPPALSLADGSSEA